MSDTTHANQFYHSIGRQAAPEGPSTDKRVLKGWRHASEFTADHLPQW